MSNDDALLDMAIELARSGDRVEARRLVRQVLAHNPDDEIAWAMSARLAQTPEEAAVCWEQVVRLRPDDREALAHLNRSQGELPTQPPIKVPEVPQRPPSTTKRQQIPVFDPRVRSVPQRPSLPAFEPMPTPKIQTKQCPYCAETILAEAIKCKYCGSDLTPALPPAAEEILLVAKESKRTLGYWLGMIFTLGAYSIVWNSRSVMVTSERLIARRGVLNKTERTIPLDKIQDITIRQNVFGSFLGFGDLVIETAGSLQPEVVFADIDQPDSVRDAIILAVQRRRWGSW